MNINKDAFEDIKDIHKGKAGILYASGPSLNYYRPLGPDNKFIHAGVNGVILNKDVRDRLDYYFYGDTKRQGAYLEKAHKFQPKLAKFVHSYRNNEPYDRHLNPTEAVSYGGIPYNECPPSEGNCRYTKDIINTPVVGGGVGYRAVQIFLFTGISKLYLVGFDASQEAIRFYKTANEGKAPSQDLVEGFNTDLSIRKGLYHDDWMAVKKFVNEEYKDVDVISVNPVYLKNYFRDHIQNEFKDEYVKAYKGREDEEY